MRAGVILLTAPRPAGACFILPAQRQSGAIKTAGSTPGPFLHTTAPTHTLADASLIHRAETARKRESWTEEAETVGEDTRVLGGSRGGHCGRDLCGVRSFLWSRFKRRALHGFCFSFQMESDWIGSFWITHRISHYLTEVKRSVSHAHSTSLVYYALIPVNSLARMEVHVWRMRAKPNWHTHQRMEETHFLSIRVTLFFPHWNEILISCLSINYITAFTTLVTCHHETFMTELTAFITAKRKSFWYQGLLFLFFYFHSTQQISISIQTCSTSHYGIFWQYYFIGWATWAHRRS